MSEEIARAYAPNPTQARALNAPIITREAHEEVVAELKGQINDLRLRLPAGVPDYDHGFDDDFDDDMDA